LVTRANQPGKEGLVWLSGSADQQHLILHDAAANQISLIRVRGDGSAAEAGQKWAQERGEGSVYETAGGGDRQGNGLGSATTATTRKTRRRRRRYGRRYDCGATKWSRFIALPLIRSGAKRSRRVSACRARIRRRLIQEEMDRALNRAVMRHARSVAPGIACWRC